MERFIAALLGLGAWVLISIDVLTLVAARSNRFLDGITGYRPQTLAAAAILLALILCLQWRSWVRLTGWALTDDAASGFR